MILSENSTKSPKILKIRYIFRYIFRYILGYLGLGWGLELGLVREKVSPKPVGVKSNAKHSVP